MGFHFSLSLLYLTPLFFISWRGPRFTFLLPPFPSSVQGSVRGGLHFILLRFFLSFFEVGQTHFLFDLTLRTRKKGQAFVFPPRHLWGIPLPEHPLQGFLALYLCSNNDILMPPLSFIGVASFLSFASLFPLLSFPFCRTILRQGSSST